MAVRSRSRRHPDLFLLSINAARVCSMTLKNINSKCEISGSEGRAYLSQCRFERRMTAVVDIADIPSLSKEGVHRNESSVWKVPYRRAGISLTLQERKGGTCEVAQLLHERSTSPRNRAWRKGYPHSCVARRRESDTRCGIPSSRGNTVARRWRLQ